ncbi:MAG TPA: hypothetical protein VMR62_27730 [Bryobacteraceae bacterium]|jgi:hypothetical protein|nr:hypothetical protein [Bryobacteraceae bacterium]
MDASALESAINAAERSWEFWDSLLNWCIGSVVFGVALEICVVTHEYKKERDEWIKAVISSPPKPSIRKLIIWAKSKVAHTAILDSVSWVAVRRAL